MARVIDLAAHPAAYSGRLLVEVGHEVIRVEPRAGDALRRLGPHLGAMSGLEHGAFHQFLNAGKRSFTPDLDTPTGKRLFLDLVTTAEVLIASLPLPVDEADILQANPRLVLVKVENGQPEACAYARSGLLCLTGHPGQRPVVMGGHVVYAATGLFVAVAAAAAMLVQQLTDAGQVVEVSLQQCLEGLAEQAMVVYTSTGKITHRRGYRGAITAVSGALPCADGYWMISVPHTPEGWAKFMDWVQDPELLSDPDLSDEAERNAKRDFILDRLETWSKRYPKEELVVEAQRRHIPASPVATPLDLVDDPQLLARGFLREMDHPEFGRVPFPMGAIASVRGNVPGYAPRLGEHNGQVLSGLGYSEQEQASLLDCGAV